VVCSWLRPMVATDQHKAEPSCELDTSPVPFGHVSTQPLRSRHSAGHGSASMTGTQLLQKMTERPIVELRPTS
jgi:hypothetical protein